MMIIYELFALIVFKEEFTLHNEEVVSVVMKVKFEVRF